MEVRRLIDRAYKAIVSRLGTYSDDNEPITETAELNVEIAIRDDLFRSLELKDVYIICDSERNHKNVEKMLHERLSAEIECYNSESEALYIESLDVRGQRDYFAWNY